MDRCWCGSDELYPFSPKYLKCRNCGTLVSQIDFLSEEEIVSEAKENKESLYGEEYWTRKMLKAADCNSLDELFSLYIQTRAEYWLSSILKYRLGSTSVCEIGCGLGQLSYLLTLAGFHVIPMELNSEICSWITENTGMKAVCGDISRCGKNLDLLIANDVLEHLVNPVSFLKTVSSGMNENGILFIQTPCYDGKSSFEEMQERNDRFLLLMEENQHVFLFTREAVSALFQRFGFTCTFVPAYFGDDYDMYFYASRQQQREYTDEEIKQYLYTLPAGRLLSSVMEMEAAERKTQKRISLMQKDLDFLNGEAQRTNIQLAEKQAENDELNRLAREGNNRILSLQESLDQLNREVQQKNEELLRKQEDILNLNSVIEKQREQYDEFRQTYENQWTNNIPQADERKILHCLTYESDKVSRRKMLLLLTGQEEGESVRFSAEDWKLIRTALKNYVDITDALLNTLEGCEQK